VPAGVRALRGPNELSAVEHRRILDEIAEAGCLWLLYTGGEIFARPDFREIYQHAKRNGLLVTLFTSGALLTPELADFLAEWRPFGIEITLYGRTRATHERITGVAGSHARCLKAIRLLVERGLPLKLKTVALTLNRHEIGEMRRFAEEELGLAFRFDAMVTCGIDCARHPLEVRLEPEEIVALDVEDARRVGEWREMASRFRAPSLAEARRLFQCGAGMNGFAIDPSGRLGLCVLAWGEAYDLRAGSFREGWEHLRRLRERSVTRATKCTDCGLRAICAMCPPQGELENGDPEAPVEFLCHVAHVQAHAMGIDVPAHGACAYCPGGMWYEALLESVERLRVAAPAARR